MNKPTTEERIQHIEVQESSWQRAAWSFVILGALVGLWGLFQISGEALSWSDKLDKLGGFLSGAVATSFSLAGLMFVYLAFLGQKKELLYQREDLALTRQEMQRQVEATKDLADENAAQKQQMELQNAQLRKQAFENTFFKTLEFHENSILRYKCANDYTNLVHGESFITKDYRNGKDCFKILHRNFKQSYNTIEVSKEKGHSIKVKKAYFIHKEALSTEFLSYYRNLMALFQLIENANYLDDSRKLFYGGLVRSNLNC